MIATGWAGHAYIITQTPVLSLIFSDPSCNCHYFAQWNQCWLRIKTGYSLALMFVVIFLTWGKQMNFLSWPSCNSAAFRGLRVIAAYGCMNPTNLVSHNDPLYSKFVWVVGWLNVFINTVQPLPSYLYHHIFFLKKSQLPQGNMTKLHNCLTLLRLCKAGSHLCFTSKVILCCETYLVCLTS